MGVPVWSPPRVVSPCGRSGSGLGLVLVLSIAVIVLDRSLRIGLGSLDQPSQYRHDVFQGRYATNVGFIINRIADN